MTRFQSLLVTCSLIGAAACGSEGQESPQQAQQEIAAIYGEFESLSYVGAWRANASPESTIYRFRARFTRGQPEIRVVHDAAGKVSGLWIKPWQDRLN